MCPSNWRSLCQSVRVICNFVTVETFSAILRLKYSRALPENPISPISEHLFFEVSRCVLLKFVCPAPFQVGQPANINRMWRKKNTNLFICLFNNNYTKLTLTWSGEPFSSADFSVALNDVLELLLLLIALEDSYWSIFFLHCCNSLFTSWNEYTNSNSLFFVKFWLIRQKRMLKKR